MPKGTNKLLQIHYTLSMCAWVLLYFLFMFSFPTSSLVWDQSYSLSLFFSPTLSLLTSIHRMPYSVKLWESHGKEKHLDLLKYSFSVLSLIKAIKTKTLRFKRSWGFGVLVFVWINSNICVQNRVMLCGNLLATCYMTNEGFGAIIIELGGGWSKFLTYSICTYVGIFIYYVKIKGIVHSKIEKSCYQPSHHSKSVWLTSIYCAEHTENFGCLTWIWENLSKWWQHFRVNYPFNCV